MVDLVATFRERLRNTALRHRLRASAIYDLYWRVSDRQVLDERDHEVEFYRSLLSDMPRPGLIYDVGANLGYKTDIFLRLGAHVVAIDPDRANYEILFRKFHWLRSRKKPVTIIDKAVSREAGVLTLWIDQPGSAKNTLSPKWVDTLRNDKERFGETLSFAGKQDVETTTIADLIREFGSPYFVKIDVEGHELDVIMGMREPVPYLSFEVNLPEFLGEGIACVTALHGLSTESTFNYSAGLSTGLALDDWLPASAFYDVVNSCGHKSIEIFCRTITGRLPPSFPQTRRQTESS